jgi:NAD(P)H dehydrogenase (quinone)
MYGHIKTLAEAEKRGIEAAGGKADVYQYAFRAIELRDNS